MGHGGQGRVPIAPKNMQNLHVSQEPLPSCFACFDGGGERKVAGPSRVGVDQVQCPLPLARHLGRMRTACPTTGSEHVKVGLQWKWIKYDKIPFDIIKRRNWGSRPSFQVVPRIKLSTPTRLDSPWAPCKCSALNWRWTQSAGLHHVFPKAMPTIAIELLVDRPRPLSPTGSPGPGRAWLKASAIRQRHGRSQRSTRNWRMMVECCRSSYPPRQQQHSAISSLPWLGHGSHWGNVHSLLAAWPGEGLRHAARHVHVDIDWWLLWRPSVLQGMQGEVVFSRKHHLFSINR